MKVLFVYQAPSTFVEKDKAILAGVHEVRPVHFRGLGDIPRLWQGTRWCDITFCWFGKVHAFFAVLFSKALGKKAIVVSGGDEAAREVIGGVPYGLCAHPLKRWVVQRVFGWTDLVLAVSRSNLEETLQNAGVRANKARLIYHGFSASEFRRLDGGRKENLVITVASSITEETVRLKSLKSFVEAARLLPETDFAIVGPLDDSPAAELRAASPPNVAFTGGLYGVELVSLLNRAHVYVQASGWESFGCALAEAMLCECVPVVSRRYSLPEVVGECGYYIDTLDAYGLAAAIEEALRDEQMGWKARGRIASHFPLEKRRKELLEVVELVLRG